jgi:hypothetical protein
VHTDIRPPVLSFPSQNYLHWRLLNSGMPRLSTLHKNLLRPFLGQNISWWWRQHVTSKQSRMYILFWGMPPWYFVCGYQHFGETRCPTLRTEDRGSILIRNACVHLWDYMVSLTLDGQNM